MFTGLVDDACPIIDLNHQLGLMTITIDFTSIGIQGLYLGASVAVNGTCLTVTAIKRNAISFQVIQETLNRTNLKYYKINDLVNIERCATFASEIGGHILSGHIHGTTSITQINSPVNNKIIWLAIPSFLQPYLFNKGYIALNGTSLTIAEVNENEFSVHLIPETLKRTTWSKVKVGELINVEIDHHTYIIVDRINHWLAKEHPTLSTP